MSRLIAGVLAALVALTTGISTALPAMGQDETPPEEKTVRMARATWDTGWFPVEIYRLLLQRLGYHVDGPITMENEEFFDAVARGDVDLWVDGWFPLHNPLLGEDDPVERVGTQVEAGALQGYLIDITTAEEHGITNLGDLADPDIARIFDRDGDGRADLVGCNPEWTCAGIIEHHLSEYGLNDTVQQIQADYSPMMLETVELFEQGEPVLFYTFTPNWTVGELVPGEDVVWLETPYPSLPPDQPEGEDQTTVSGVQGCVANPCQMGWPPSDIEPVANSDFLDANPAVRTLLEEVSIPLDDILDQNARMVDGEGDIGDIRRHAQEWVAANETIVSEWINTADPDAIPVTDDAGEETAPGGVLRVAAQTLPPFVTYGNQTYGGFEVELVELIARQLGMEAEIYAVDTVAKQIDDVTRGAADIALGGVAITKDREAMVNFSIPVLHSGLTILTPTQSEQGIGGSILGFFRTIAASDVPWLLAVFMVGVLFAAHLIWLLERRRNPDFDEGYLKGIWDSFYWSVVTMSTVGYGDKVARGNIGRSVALLWIAAGTLLFATFTAAIASALAVEELRGSITGPDDLPGHRVATVAGTPGESFLSTQGIGPVLVDDIDEAYEALADGDVEAIVFDAPVLHFHSVRQGAGEVATVGPDFENVQYGIVIGRDNPDLREDINLELLELIESGIYQQLHDKWFGSLP